MPGFKLAKKAYEVYLENPNIHGTFTHDGSSLQH